MLPIVLCQGKVFTHSAGFGMIDEAHQKGDQPMGKKIAILLSFSLLLLAPGLAVSDCADFSRMTSWNVQGSQTVIFFTGNIPFAQIDLQDCTVDSSSNVRLMKSYVCDSDSVMVNGQECAIMTLTITQ
jgi:hypothetical protein